MKNYKIILAALCFICIFSCSKTETKKSIKYKDGVYKSFANIKDDWGGTAEVEIKIEEGKIVECTFLCYEKNGNLKGPEYGKVDGVIKNNTASAVKLLFFPFYAPHLRFLPKRSVCENFFRYGLPVRCKANRRLSPASTTALQFSCPKIAAGLKASK